MAVVKGGCNAGMIMMIGVVLLFQVLVSPALAEVYTVGDDKSWSIGVDYTLWTQGKTFKVGDQLVFKYTPNSHDVMEVSQSDYETCTKPANPIAVYTTGDDTITLRSTGDQYFICSYIGHCAAKMKVAIKVVDATPIQSPAPTSSPSLVKSPTPSPSPSSIGAPTAVSFASALPTPFSLLTILITLFSLFINKIHF